MYRVRKITFFLENALKKITDYFLKFLFIMEIMENNFIQITASAGHESSTFGSIFKHIIDGFTNIVL